MNLLIHRTRLPGRATGGTIIAIAVLFAFANVRLTAVPAQTGTADQKAPPPAKTVRQVKPPFTFTIKTITPAGQPQAGVKVRCLHPRAERGPALVDMIVASNESGHRRCQGLARCAGCLSRRLAWCRRQ